MNVRTKLAAALSIAALALVTGCKGDTGPQGPAGPSGDAGPPGSPGATLIEVPSNSQAPTDASNAMWTALQPQITVQSVTIASPPVVKFKVTDAVTGAVVTGLGNTSLASGAKYPSFPNLAFAIAKLVPGTPSRWVSYIVTTVPTLTSDGGTTTPGPTRPGTDNTGTLVDNGDGTYAYTFFRDITQTKSLVDGMTFTGANVKADLDDLTYDPTLVHRVTIQLSGNAPGTGTNTPNGVQNVAGVVLVHAADGIYDFTPSTGQAATNSGRDMVTTANCDTCHSVLGGIPGGSPEANGAGFHGGSRNDAKYCVVCHTEQRKFGRTEAPIDSATLTFKSADGGTDINTTTTYRVYDRSLGRFPNFIHHIHGGSVLALKNYNFAGVTFNDVLYPQDLRNCTKCHDPSNPATPQAINFENVPNRVACGGCHDGIDFATGKGVTIADALQGKTVSPQGHVGGIQPDDSQCAACHSDPNRPDINIDAVHRPVTPPNSANALVLGGTNQNTNAAWIASNPARLPPGAIPVSYDIKSVSVTAGGNPQMVFRILQNGQRKDFNDPVTSTPNPATGQTEIWDNFMGAPSIYFVFSVPQDGDTTPSDYNAAVNGYLRTIWNKSASSVGSLTGPDANGYYTVTLVGSTIPASAVMLTGGVGYSYNNNNTLPLTQTNLAPYPVSAPTASPAPACAASTTNVCKQGGLIVIAPNAQKVATGFTARRPIVEDARCNACHQELGAFTEDAFHAGQRNDGTTCSWCHTPNKTSNGWSADSTYFVHAIHAADKRQFPFTWDASSITESFANVGYPGVLNNCQACHLPGTYDFSASASASALPHKQYRTVATGAFNKVSGSVIPQPYSFNKLTSVCDANTNPQTDLGVFELSPYLLAQPSLGGYGVAFSFNAGASPAKSCDEAGNVLTIPSQQSTPVANTATNLVNSPVAGVCIACHDTDAAQAHFTINGGSIYKPRSTALNTVETCMICHGPGAIADIAQVHK